MNFWILYLVVLVVVIIAYNSLEQIVTLIKNDKRLIIPFLVGMFLGYLIFF